MREASGSHGDQDGQPSTSTRLGPSFNSAQAASTPQSRKRKVSWADAQTSHDNQAANPSEQQSLPRNGAAIRHHRKMGTSERKLLNDVELETPRRDLGKSEQVPKGDKSRRNGSVQSRPETDSSNNRRNGNSTLSRAEAISLEELGESSRSHTCCPPVPEVRQHREQEMPWKSKLDYLVVVMTYVLGIGNVIRFPQLCYKHGGGKRST